MQHLTQDNIKEFKLRYGGFHDGFLEEIRLISRDKKHDSMIIFSVVIKDIESKDDNKIRIQFTLSGISEYYYTVFDDEAYTHFIIFEMAIYWYNDRVWVDLFGEDNPYHDVNTTRNSKRYFSGKALSYIVSNVAEM